LQTIFAVSLILLSILIARLGVNHRGNRGIHGEHGDKLVQILAD
jgi:hypothetical protein